MRSPAPLLCLALAAALAALPAAADKGRGSDDGDRRDWADEDRSHDRARRAAERGEILPWRRSTSGPWRSLPGRVLEAELERKRGLWVYELKILDAGGRLFEVYLDAGTGAVLKHGGGGLMRILVVEDDPRTVETLTRALEGAGYLVDHTDEGRTPGSGATPSPMPPPSWTWGSRAWTGWRCSSAGARRVRTCRC
jgi:uncharacterized membrane protein YkoI